MALERTKRERTTGTNMAKIDLNSPELYFNRELSQLEFHKRVLKQAEDESIPLLERLRFLCISSTNLDEFFETAVVRRALSLPDADPRGR